MKLNIGSGDVVMEGFQALDRKFGDEAYPLQLKDKKLEADSIEEMRASHVLEHFAFDQVPSVLRNWVHCLQPGGRIRIAVPDYDKIQDLRKAGDKLWRKYLLGSQIDEDDFHKSIYTRDGLQELMERAGLINVKPWHSHNSDTACLPVSLNLEGTKPDHWEAEPEAKSVDVKITAIMSQPRYCAGTPRGAIEASLRPFNVPLHHFIGAYWSHCMENAFEDLIDCDWLLTFDYDTMIKDWQLDRLMTIFGRNPHIDALVALQVKRHADTPLFTITGQHGVETDGSPIKIDTGHFGCTLLRTEALRKLSRPYFWEIPRMAGSSWRDEEEGVKGQQVNPFVAKLWGDPHFQEIIGSKGEIHIDSDIWFWKQWQHAGNSLYCAPDVRVGHLEEIVGFYDDKMKVQHIYSHKWREHHRGRTAEELAQEQDGKHSGTDSA